MWMLGLAVGLVGLLAALRDEDLVPLWHYLGYIVAFFFGMTWFMLETHHLLIGY